MFMCISTNTLHQTLATLPVLLNEFIVGMGWCWAAPVLSMVRNGETDFQLTDEQASWMTSINELGRFSGPFLTAILLDRIGRKYTISLVSILLFGSFAGLLFVQQILAIYALRLMFGASNGISDVSSSIYLAENMSPTFRGVVASWVSITFYAGMMVEYSLGAYLSYNALAIVNTLIAFCAISCSYLVTETPYYLTMKEKHEKAEKNLIWLQGGGDRDHLAQELTKIKENAQAEKLKKTSITMLFSSPENVKSILIVLGVYLLTAPTGSASIAVYSSIVFPSSETINSDQFTIIYGVIQFLAVCMSPFIVEKFNRRTLLMVSLTICGLFHACTFTLFSLHSGDVVIACYPWLVFIFVTGHMSLFALIYPVLYMLRGELFPMSIKAVGGCMTIMVQSILSFLTSKVFLFIADEWGMQMNFLWYSIMCLLSVIYTYLIVPETRGKTLVDIQKAFQ